MRCLPQMSQPVPARMRCRGYSAKFAASERLKFSGTPSFIKLNFINRVGRVQRTAMKFYKAAAQQEVRRLNLKFYPAQVAARIV